MQGPITCNMRIETILQRWPHARQVFRDLGIDCADCHRARFETLADGARTHDLDLKALLHRLNEAAGTEPRTEGRYPSPLTVHTGPTPSREGSGGAARPR